MSNDLRHLTFRGYNPILPPWEYVPDGEPHVFGDRLYLFGSHDREGGLRYCACGNYVGWSTPLSDPTAWECSGTIYEASQDPHYVPGETNDLYAPDVVRGNDGRYYLYYTMVTSGETASGQNRIGVAVCDSPNGRYSYLGDVRNPDGSIHRTYLTHDPAVINDDGVIRLYCGWSLSMVAAAAHSRGAGMENEAATSRKRERLSRTADRHLPSPGSPEMQEALLPVYQMMFRRSPQEISRLKYPLMGANAMVLREDMLTVDGEVRRIVPGQFDTPSDSDFYGHAFYEAASIRKINGRYYFIYSSENSHELCYATSAFPDREFRFGGVLISNGDVGYRNRKPEDRLNMTGNDHGSLECVNGQWYIFHHRQTHKSTFSRQACAEKIRILPDGSIPQVECTSLGLREGLLPTDGTYPALICCNLTNGHMPHCTNTRLEETIPCVTNEGEERFLTGMTDGACAGYKYFAFSGSCRLTLTCRSPYDSLWEIRTDREKAAEIAVPASDVWAGGSAEITLHGTQALYLIRRGKGSADLLEFSLEALGHDTDGKEKYL